jgi:RNA polymerase sigma factor (sigma-70 family)
VDIEVVIRAQRGDPVAFEALARASHPRLQRVAVGILRDQHLAEDAVQRALLAIWRQVPTLRDPNRFEGWSYRVLVHACYAEARRQVAWLPTTAIGSREESVVSDMSASVLHRDQLERAVGRLSVDQRAVVVVHHVMDLTHDEVAHALGVPAGTVASRLHRALGALRAALEADARPASAESMAQEVVR